MKRFSFLAALAAAAALAAPAMAASLVNGSFEMGDTTGWATGGSGTVDVLTGAVDFYQVAPLGQGYAPTDRQFLAQLTAGPDDDYTTLSQGFVLTQASTLSLDSAFLAFDEAEDGFNDDGFIRVTNLDTLATLTLFEDDVATVGDYLSTGWTHQTQALVAGNYLLEAGVRNVGDAAEGYSPGYDSKLLIDNVQIAVPEPAAWALMMLGFGAAGAALRARRTAGSAVSI